MCSNGPPKSWIDDPFFCKIQNQGRSSEPLLRESKLFTFKHVHFQDEALVFHRKDFTLLVVLPTLGTSLSARSCLCIVQDQFRVIKNNTATGDVVLIAQVATNHGGWYNLSGYTSSSSALVFCAAKKPHCIHANTQLRLWYGEDLRGYTESDNGGKTCADVYGLLV